MSPFISKVIDITYPLILWKKLLHKRFLLYIVIEIPIYISVGYTGIFRRYRKCMKMAAGPTKMI